MYTLAAANRLCVCLVRHSETQMNCLRYACMSNAAEQMFKNNLYLASECPCDVVENQYDNMSSSFECLLLLRFRGDVFSFSIHSIHHKVCILAM